MLAWHALYCHLLSSKLDTKEAMVGRAEMFVQLTRYYLEKEVSGFYIEIEIKIY